MISHLFHPDKIDTHDTLILLPFVPGGRLLPALDRTAGSRKKILGSTLISLKNVSVLHGFLGYSALLTVLEFIAEIRDKRIIFLGTAGSLAADPAEPGLLAVDRIYAGGIFTSFGPEKFLDLDGSGAGKTPCVTGISVDLIQRETPRWLNQARKTGASFVEMELFPLRWYLENPFQAFVVLSDRVTENGIIPFHRKRTAEEFEKGFTMIMEEFL